jgi:hypothetical protein
MGRVQAAIFSMNGGKDQVVNFSGLQNRFGFDLDRNVRPCSLPSLKACICQCLRGYKTYQAQSTGASVYHRRSATIFDLQRRLSVTGKSQVWIPAEYISNSVMLIRINSLKSAIA